MLDSHALAHHLAFVIVHGRALICHNFKSEDLLPQRLQYDSSVKALHTYLPEIFPVAHELAMKIFTIIIFYECTAITMKQLHGYMGCGT